MSQPIKSSFNESFNNQPPNVPYFSQPINNNISQLLESKNINKKDENFVYELVFSIVSNISNSNKPNDIKIKIIRILTKLVNNILKAEAKKEDSEKYRRIKVGNPNISLLFEIKENYDLIKLLGFEEEFYDEDLTLYLPKENINISFFQEVSSYIELLLLNFEENFENNYYESTNNNQIKEEEKDTTNNNINNIEKEDMDIENNINNIPDDSDINKINNIENDNYNNQDIKEILKNTAQVRLGKNIENLEYGDNWNMKPPGPSYEGSRILRQTGQERYRKALQYSNNNSGNNNKINDNNFHPNIHGFGDLNNQSSFKSNDKFSTCKDDIGKKCLELTNQFRAKNKLPPLKWDDSIWKISLTHSKNMGERKVPFGHKGFDERIKQFPFYFSLACENVFMCQGYGEYSIAENAVNGWINSPGHRKNLLSDTNYCAIATYRTSSGAYYLTQMFARK